MEPEADYQRDLERIKRDVNRCDGLVVGLIAGFVALIVAACLSGCAASAHGEWYEYQPAGAKNNCDILSDVTSRAHDPKLNKFRSNKATWTHEGTHCVNGEIRKYVSSDARAFYVGDGRAMVLREPNISFEQLDRHVTEYRNATYQMYFKQARSNKDRLDFLDEWSAYCNDLQCTNEFKLRDDGNYERAHWFAAWADALVATVRDHDPGYSQLDDLTEFVDWQKDRLATLKRGTDQ